MPSMAMGTTLISRKMTSSRVRTLTRGAPGTAVTPPSGKNAGSVSRQWCSTRKKTVATASDPAIRVPNIMRAEYRGSKEPSMSGHTTPQMTDASIHPTAETPANMKGTCSARRRPRSLAAPEPALSRSGADQRTLIL